MHANLIHVQLPANLLTSIARVTVERWLAGSKVEQAIAGSIGGDSIVDAVDNFAVARVPRHVRELVLVAESDSHFCKIRVVVF